jgi:hypothetical protein
LPHTIRAASFTDGSIGEEKMKKYGSASLFAAIIALSSVQCWAQTPVDVSRFDIAGIKLRMPISEVAAVFKRLQERDGGEMLGMEELEKALKDYNSMKETRYFGYSSQIYKIGVTLSPPYQMDNKSFPPSVIDVIYVINDYSKDSGARAQVLEKYGAPTFDDKESGDIKYCQKLTNDGGNNSKTCDVKHGDTLFFINGTLYLSDKDFEELIKTRSTPSPSPKP